MVKNEEIALRLVMLYLEIAYKINQVSSSFVCERFLTVLVMYRCG